MESVVYSVHADAYLRRDRVPLVAGDKEAIVVLKPGIELTLRVCRDRQIIDWFNIQTGTVSEGSQDFRWGPASIGQRQGDYRTSLEAENGPYQIRISADGYASADDASSG